MEPEQVVPTAEETAPASTPETNPEVSQPTGSEPAQTPAEETPEQRMVPLAALQEERRKRQELAAALQGTPQSSSMSASATQPASLQEDGEAQAKALLEDALSNVVSKQFGDVAQFMREQKANSQIEQARQQFPDFDQHLDSVVDVLKSNPDLRNVGNPLNVAYLISKGMSSSVAVDQAKKEGQRAAYQTIDQKVAARPGSPIANKPRGEGKSDLMKRYEAGQLSPAETAANWAQIIQEKAGN